MINYLVVILAQYHFTRFPGKSLVDIHYKFMIQQVWGKCAEATSSSRGLVATNDDCILDHCKDHERVKELVHD